MSWFSRAGSSWGGGRFSPFGRPATNAPNVVDDSNYSYITNEDINDLHNNSRTPEIVDWDDKDPGRDTDVLQFKHGRVSYPCHFPAHAIKNGDLRIGSVRQAAAKKIGVGDPRRVRMFCKGKNLRHDERTAREEGLRGDGTGSEILCVVGEASTSQMAPGFEELSTHDQATDDDEDGDDPTDSVTGIAKRKPRKRGGKKNKKKSEPVSTGDSSPLGYSNTLSAGAEFLPTPSQFSGPRPESAPPPQSRPGTATPHTPIGKMDALAGKFHSEFVPLCMNFLQNPPDEKSKRDSEYKKLSETILAQILLKLDGIETEGDAEARLRRKALVKEVQGMLNSLDEVVT